MPNKGRGEVELTVGGRTYVLRPSFETMAAIEDATDTGAVDLLTRGRENTASLKMNHVVTVLWVAAKKSKNRDVPPIEEFGELLRTKMGLIKAMTIMLHFLGNSLCSDKQREEAEAAAEDETRLRDAVDTDPSQPSEEEKPSPNQPA